MRDIGSCSDNLNGRVKLAAAFDEVIWDRICGLIDSAHDVDQKKYWALMQSLDAEFDLRRMQYAVLYLWILLRVALSGKVGGKVPTGDDFSRISSGCFANFPILTAADRVT